MRTTTLTAALLFAACSGETTITPEPVIEHGATEAPAVDEADPTGEADSGVGTEEDSGATAMTDKPTPTRETVYKVVVVPNDDGLGHHPTYFGPMPGAAIYGTDTPEGLTPGTYDGVFLDTVMGDYYHFTFDLGGDIIDFGSGDNQLVGTVFEDKIGFNLDHLKGKEFTVTWDYRESTFTCCSGSMDTYLGMKPSIVGLSPIE